MRACVRACMKGAHDIILADGHKCLNNVVLISFIL